MRLPQQWNAEVLCSLSLSLFCLVCVCGSSAWVSTCPFFAALHSRVQEPEFALAAVARHGKDVEARGPVAGFGLQGTRAFQTWLCRISSWTDPACGLAEVEWALLWSRRSAAHLALHLTPDGHELCKQLTSKEVD